MCELLHFLHLHSNCGLFARTASTSCGMGGGGEIDVKSCHLRGTRGGYGRKRLVPALSSQSILFVLSKRHPPSPNALWHPGLVDVVHRVRGRPRVPPPRNWVTAAGRWDAKQSKCNGGSEWPDRDGFTRATSISPRTTVPGLYTPYPEWHEWALNGPFWPIQTFRVWSRGGEGGDSGPGRNGRCPGEPIPVWLRPGEPIPVWLGRTPHCTWSVSHPIGPRRSLDSGVGWGWGRLEVSL